MKNQIPNSLRRWEERAAATKLADAILRGDRRRQRRMATNDELRGQPAEPINKKREGAFDALKRHPLYAPRHGAQRP
jgi:hypothetical protein